MAAAKVLGLARGTLGLPHFQIVPPPVPADPRPWGHDCREQKSWRCVWCEELFCFECDTGTTTCMDSYPDLRLCDKHYIELPRLTSSSNVLTEYKPNALSSLRTQFIDLGQLARRSFRAVTGGGKNNDKNSRDDTKIYCNCLCSKILICRSCRPLAKEWKMQQLGLDNFPVCAYCRFPGGCEARPNQSCDCNGRGVDCNFIDDAAWQKMEEDDVLWLGRSAENDSDEPYQSKKDKKDLRCVFGDNFPYRSVDHERSRDKLNYKKVEARVEEKPLPELTTRKVSAAGSLKKKLSAGVSYLRPSRSTYSLTNAKKTLAAAPKRSFSVLSRASSAKSDHFNTEVETSRRSSIFLQNPQFRKPYSNFRVGKHDLSPHLPEPNKYAGGRSYLDIDTESNYDVDHSRIDVYQDYAETASPIQPIINPELDFIASTPDLGLDDASSIASSPSFTFSDGYDSYEEESYNAHVALAPPPPPRPASAGLEVATARLMNRSPSTPRLMEMRSSPNLNSFFNNSSGSGTGNDTRADTVKRSGTVTSRIEGGPGILYKNKEAVVSEREITIHVEHVAASGGAICGTFGDNNGSSNTVNANFHRKAAANKWGCSNQISASDFDRNGIQRHAFWRCSFCDGKIKGI